MQCSVFFAVDELIILQHFSFYASCLDHLLQEVYVPFSTFNSTACPIAIDQFYNFTLTSMTVSLSVSPFHTDKYASSNFNY